MKNLLLITVAFTLQFASAQVGEIQWQNTIGGNNNDNLFELIHTADGGFITCGYSESSLSGDKTEASMGGSDYWIVKFDETGAIEWQNTIGGSSMDIASCIQQTADGGYIVGGYSSSGVSGDKTEATIAGSTDYWLVKLNSLGAIEWQNSIGGAGFDVLLSVCQTLDGGYVLGGYSDSPISGDKSEPSFGLYDYWIVKVNASGILQWENTIGGSDYDLAYSIVQKADGKIIAGGYSSSHISGEKTTLNKGGRDFWLVTLNTSGVLVGQTVIGGGCDDVFADLEVTPDNGLIVCGASCSGIGGDKTEANMGGGWNDYWILKLNSIGVIEWQNTIGGNMDDFLLDVAQTADNGYILAGRSLSGISGDKTELNIGFWDYWVVKLNATGDILWENSIGGWLDDYLQGIVQLNNGEFVLGGNSWSPVSGDKTESNVGGSDNWIINIFPDCTIGAPEYCNTIDDDCDGVIDEGVEEDISIAAGGATTFCQGGSVLLSATYSGTSVQWLKNGLNIAGATATTYSAATTGNYTCLTGSVCDTASSNEITVQVLKKPNAFIYADGPTLFCPGGSVTLIANTGGGLTYQWYKGVTLLAGATNVTYIATTTGNYSCLVTKAVSGCSKKSNAIAVSVVCKENGTEDKTAFSIYPNPAGNTFNISGTMPDELAILEIYNTAGQIIYSMELDAPGGTYKKQIEVSTVAGMYFIRIFSANTELWHKLVFE